MATAYAVVNPNAAPGAMLAAISHGPLPYVYVPSAQYAAIKAAIPLMPYSMPILLVETLDSPIKHRMKHVRPTTTTVSTQTSSILCV